MKTIKSQRARWMWHVKTGPAERYIKRPLIEGDDLEDDEKIETPKLEEQQLKIETAGGR